MAVPGIWLFSLGGLGAISLGINTLFRFSCLSPWDYSKLPQSFDRQHPRTTFRKRSPASTAAAVTTSEAHKAHGNRNRTSSRGRWWQRPSYGPCSGRRSYCNARHGYLPYSRRPQTPHSDDTVFREASHERHRGLNLKFQAVVRTWTP